jgi:hypothetical protein
MHIEIGTDKLSLALTRRYLKADATALINMSFNDARQNEAYHASFEKNQNLNYRNRCRRIVKISNFTWSN